MSDTVSSSTGVTIEDIVEDPSTTLPPPVTTPRKQVLESYVAEFIENEWELLKEVHILKEYSSAEVKSLPPTEPKGK